MPAAQDGTALAPAEAEVRKVKRGSRRGPGQPGLYGILPDSLIPELHPRSKHVPARS
ncbi:Uncharacterised protein [Bordetella pertussis]|nr:Uncharacterised protein [Bordetella pertussis]